MIAACDFIYILTSMRHAEHCLTYILGQFGVLVAASALEARFILDSWTSVVLDGVKQL